MTQPTKADEARIEALEDKIYDLLEAEKVQWGVALAAMSLVMTCLVANIAKQVPQQELTETIARLFDQMRDSTIRASSSMKKDKGGDGKEMER